MTASLPENILPDGMRKLPTIEEVDNELAELERQMAGYDALSRRHDLLLRYKELAAQIMSGAEGSEKEAPTASAREGHSDQPAANSPTRARNKTADLADQVLSGVPPVHITELLRMMRESGWIGSGTDRKDKKAIVTALQNQPKRFVKVSEGTWALQATHRSSLK